MAYRWFGAGTTFAWNRFNKNFSFNLFIYRKLIFRRSKASLLLIGALKVDFLITEGGHFRNFIYDRIMHQTLRACKMVPVREREVRLF